METNNLNPQPSLPNATATLVLGILSIILCGFIGLALGIVAISLYNKDKKIMLENNNFTKGSISNSNAGRTCAIIGVIVQAIVSVIAIFLIILEISIFNDIFRIGY